MADVIHKTTFEFRASVNTPDFPSGTWLINPLWNPDQATILAVAAGHRKITGGDTVEEMTAGEKLDNPLAGVDGAESGSFKDPVRAATTAALAAHTRSGNVLTASANGAFPAQDGITLTADQRLLVKNEGSGTHLENGPYILATVGDGTHPWKLQRVADFDSDADVARCLAIRVQEGTVNGDMEFCLTTTGTITLNTTALTFEPDLLTGAWKAWTPTLTNMTLGDGTVVARYSQVGKTVTAHFKFTLGSTSAMGTAPTISLPVTADASVGAETVFGIIRILDSGVEYFTGLIVWASTTTMELRRLSDSTRDGTITSTVPMTWTTGDIMTATFTYEAA